MVNRKWLGARHGWLCRLFTIHDLPFTIHHWMDNEEIARRFNRMGSLMEVRGEDTFRIRSYRMAAEAIETWPTPMKEIAAKDGAAGLQEIPGVGKAIAGKIVDLLELPGVGPKTAAMLHRKFKIASLDDLRKFAAGGGLEMVDGIGAKTAERIRRQL